MTPVTFHNETEQVQSSKRQDKDDNAPKQLSLDQTGHDGSSTSPSLYGMLKSLMP